MHRVAVVTLRGYREWTESLGPRREHIIQKVQAGLHMALWRHFTSIGAFPHHTRYDAAVALVNNIPTTLIEKAVNMLRKASPVPVEYCIGTGPTPYEAYLSCGEAAGEGDNYAVLAHMDMVDSTHVTRANGPLHVYLQILHIISDLGDLCKRLGCIALYLGGDNVAVLLPEPKAAYEIAERVPVPVRVGVGVAKRPYTAFVKATKALDYLRSRGVVGVKVVK